MIAIAEHADGCILPVRAQPGARKAGILGEHAGALKVAVTAPPEDGRANRALTEGLAAQQSDEQFNATLDSAIAMIAKASST